MDKKRGRPIGFRLSDETKKAISESKTGHRHSEETKNKISRSLIAYFRKKRPMSDEIINMYCRVGDDTMCNWIMAVKERLDSFEEIKTYRAILTAEQYEGACGGDIESLSHSMTPEVLVLFKEYCEGMGLNMDVVFDEIMKD